LFARLGRLHACRLRLLRGYRLLWHLRTGRQRSDDERCIRAQASEPQIDFFIMILLCSV